MGDQLVSSQGVLVPIESISNLNEITTVYNLRVADHHTYFVGGALWGWDVWVHNAYKVLTGKAPEVPAFGSSTYVWNGRVRTRTQGVLSWTETNSRGKTVSKFVDGIESGENNARKNVPGINAIFSKLDDPNWYHVEAQAIAIINRERGIRTATLRVNNRICPDCLGETMAYRLRKGATLEIIDPNGNVHRIQGRGPAKGSY